jgi:hypothetical protein
VSSANRSPLPEGVPDLPPFSLDIQALDLGAGLKAIGLELLETESREVVRGPDAARIWAAAVPALAAGEPYVMDFFSHVDRVRDFCDMHQIPVREAADRCVVLPQLDEATLVSLFERFEKETFGVRTGPAVQTPDTELENDLSHRGLDAYQAAYTRYAFCAVLEPEDAWVTLLSASLWPTEAIRRVRPIAQRFNIHIARPQ